jgi:hypothetical protein
MHMTESVFAQYTPKAWPFEYRGTLEIDRIAGGTPADPKIAEAWIQKNLGAQTEALLQKMVAEIMTDLGVSKDVAAKEAATRRHLTAFRRDDELGLYIMGYQLKAAIKEAVSCAVAAGKIRQHKWGKTNKSLIGFVAEHICVVEKRLHLGVMKPTGVDQRFVQTWRGAGIHLAEYCENVSLDFTIATDWDFSQEEWATIWLTGEKQGIGATRSQGYGEYVVTKWENTRAPKG